jgi:hypothetical protein
MRDIRKSSISLALCFTSTTTPQQEMADNIYFNCNLFMDLLDRHAQLQQKFSRTNEEMFHEMGSSFAAATHQLASSPLTAESAQALMMCWNAIRTFRQEQQLLADCADRIIAYLAQMKPSTASSSSFHFLSPQSIPEKPKRGGGKEKAKRLYTPRNSGKQSKSTDQQEAEAVLQDLDNRAKDDLQQLVEQLDVAQQADGQTAALMTTSKAPFSIDLDGSQIPDW